MIEEWGSPPIGVGIASTPAGGHELIVLNYRTCGKRGEPQVVHVDQEDDYGIAVVAPDFETFIRGLVAEAEYETSEERRAAAIATVERGTLSPIVVRALARQTVDKKDFFAFQDDERPPSLCPSEPLEA